MSRYEHSCSNEASFGVSRRVSSPQQAFFFAITAAAQVVEPGLQFAPFVPARGHYAKLAQLDPHPAKPDLPVDAERWITNPKSIERIEEMQPEFVKVRLNTFALPPCPANSSKQTQAKLITYCVYKRIARRPKAAFLYFAPWGYCLTTKHCPTIKSSCPEFASQQRNLFYVGARSVPG